MVVHLEHAPVTDAAVVAARRLRRDAHLTDGDNFRDVLRQTPVTTVKQRNGKHRTHNTERFNDALNTCSI